MAGGVTARLQTIGTGHLAVGGALGPGTLVVAAGFFALLLDGASLDAGLFALLQRQRPGAGVGLGVTLCPGSLGVPALRVLRLSVGLGF